MADRHPRAPKTPAFWAIVDAHRAPEDAELADVLDRLGNPDAVTLERIASLAGADFAGWLRDRKNRRTIPHRMEAIGYVPVRNSADVRDGQWRVDGKRQTVYAGAKLSMRDQIAAATEIARSS